MYVCMHKHIKRKGEREALGRIGERKENGAESCDYILIIKMLL